MKTVGVYAGSFNEWHAGHDDVLKKSLQIFDEVIVLVGLNPEKWSQTGTDLDAYSVWATAVDPIGVEESHRVKADFFTGLLADHIRKLIDNKINVVANIRGIRNAQDFEYEKTQQYHNEDLDIPVPTIYFISDRKLVHVSSSAMKAIDALRGQK